MRDDDERDTIKWCEKLLYISNNKNMLLNDDERETIKWCEQIINRSTNQNKIVERRTHVERDGDDVERERRVGDAAEGRRATQRRRHQFVTSTMTLSGSQTLLLSRRDAPCRLSVARHSARNKMV